MQLFRSANLPSSYRHRKACCSKYALPFRPGALFLKQFIDVLHRLCQSQAVHLAPAVLAILNGAFKVMTRNLDGHGVGKHLTCSLIVFAPGDMRQRNPHRMTIRQKLDVHGIRVPRGNGHDQRLIEAVDCFAGAKVGNVEVLVHTEASTISCSAHRHKGLWTQSNCRAQSASQTADFMVNTSHRIQRHQRRHSHTEDRARQVEERECHHPQYGVPPGSSEHSAQRQE